MTPQESGLIFRTSSNQYTVYSTQKRCYFLEYVIWQVKQGQNQPSTVPSTLFFMLLLLIFAHESLCIKENMLALAFSQYLTGQ